MFRIFRHEVDIMIAMEEVSLATLSGLYSRIFFGLNSTGFTDNISKLMRCLLPYFSGNKLSEIHTVHFRITRFPSFGPSHLI